MGSDDLLPIVPPGETARERLLRRIWLTIVALLIVGSFVAFGLLLLFRWQEDAAIDAAARRTTYSSSTESGATRPQTTRPISQVPQAGPGLVWVNTASKVYHFPGYRWFGRTVLGKYVSEPDALAEGDRAALNERRPVGFGARVLQ